MRHLEKKPDSWLWRTTRLPYFLDMEKGSFYLLEFMFRRIPNWKNLVQYYARKFNTNLIWLGDIKDGEVIK